MKNLCFIVFCFLHTLCFSQQQVANYVNNGSFEKIHYCTPGNSLSKAKAWIGAGSDSSYSGCGLFSVNCFSNVPVTGWGYQNPADGNTFCLFTSYCANMCFYPIIRSYPRNRLKANLVSGQTYCVKMQVSLTNVSPRAINKLGFYFGNNALDTIKYPAVPLTYLNPQIESNTIYADTLNWSTLSGTFTANGTEKFLVIGNFKSDAQTTTSITLPNSAEDWAEYFIDAVSCIPVNLPAYAGPDKRCIVGDSVYLGRESDFAIDPYCQWYQLPNTSSTIAVSSGLWVKPTNTSTYVVRQELECGSVFWDTVVVYKDAVGNVELGMLNDELRMSPNPAADEVVLSVFNLTLSQYFLQVEIVDAQGRVLKKIVISDSAASLKIDVSDFASGMYLLRLQGREQEFLLRRKLVVQR